MPENEADETSSDDGGERRKPDLNRPAPSVEGILRIYNDARIWVNISERREIPPGNPINSDELVEQLQQEGYTEYKAKNIIDAYAEKGVLEHNFTVRPAESGWDCYADFVSF